MLSREIPKTKRPPDSVLFLPSPNSRYMTFFLIPQSNSNRNNRIQQRDTPSNVDTMYDKTVLSGSWLEFPPSTHRLLGLIDPTGSYLAILKILVHFQTNGKSLKFFKLHCRGKAGHTIRLFRKTHSNCSVKNKLEESLCGCRGLIQEAVVLCGSLQGLHWHARRVQLEMSAVMHQPSG